MNTEQKWLPMLSRAAAAGLAGLGLALLLCCPAQMCALPRWCAAGLRVLLPARSRRGRSRGGHLAER